MILMLYNKWVCKEFLLPNIYDADYKLHLYKEMFQLKEDVEILLENSSKGWELVSTEKYGIWQKQQSQDRHLLINEEIVGILTNYNEVLDIVVIDTQLCFPITEKYDIRMMQEISIGKADGNLIQYRFMELISSFHMTLSKQSDGWYLSDTSTNGIFCENVRVKGQRRLYFGDHIEIFGLHILFLGEMLAVGTFYGELNIRNDILVPIHIEEKQEEGYRGREADISYFHRSPRNLPILHRQKIEIEAPPPQRVEKEKPLLFTIGPAFTMAIPMLLGSGMAIFGSQLSGQSSGAFMYTGLVTAVASAGLGVMWGILNMNYSKKERQEEETQRFNAYSNYLIQVANNIREKYIHNTESMKQMYPSAQQCLQYDRHSSELWNRNFGHKDFLYQRLGLGDQPFQVSIEIPKEKFTLLNDSLLEKPIMIKSEFETLKQVPIGISLMEKTLIGLVGGEGKRGAIQMMHMLVAGITAAHSYTDVKLVFVYRELEHEKQKEWECMRWFSHIWSEDKRTRYMASNKIETSDVFFELSGIIRNRSEEAESQLGKPKTFVKPHYVLFVSDPSILEEEILKKYIYEAKPEYGVTTFLMVETLEQLPNECEEVIESHDHVHCVYNLLDTEHGKTPFIPDMVTKEALEKFGKTLANIRINETESSKEIPNRLDFLEMYGVSKFSELEILKRWRKNRSYESMKALIGKKAGNQDCYLDIHEKFHGPHGLVAGTTGSGKSELLQTYILSLAVNFSPEDVSFFIIDFKGGGMANLFSDLPHLSGHISNLSGNQVQRALISIKSEKHRRETLFSQYGVNRINLYTKLYKNKETDIPIPHLFIIIDEFAELKREEPDFMRELISIAQVGRSLGIHLILATQKPAGTVDDNIWGNTKFRLCLRVQDRQDSNDMLHKPDAAFITQAGRCYLQVGNDEIYECFQSGYSGGAYYENVGRQTSTTALLTRTGKAELVGMSGTHRKEVSKVASGKEKTQLEVLVDYIKNLAEENNYGETHHLWLPLLKEELYLTELPGYQETCYENHAWKTLSGKWSLDVLMGMYDDPHNQMQLPVSLNLTEGGHHAICGGVVSGKSTFLQTMVFSLISKYSPNELQMYLLDYSSHMLAPFEKAPHVGGVIYDTEEDKQAKFMHMLTGMMEERKKMFRGGNYSQYVQAYGVKESAILIVIDNYSSFCEKTKNNYDSIMLRLAREGVSYGIFLVVTAAGFGISEIPSRIADNIRTVFALEMADKFKYMDILRATNITTIPESDVKGRGLVNIDGRILEYQTALSMPAEDDFERAQKIERYCEEMQEHWTGAVARKIPEIPENPTLALLAQEQGYMELLQTREYLPFAYQMEDASVYGMDLKKNYCYAITGKTHAGKTNILKLLLASAMAMQSQICIVETKTSELKKTATQANGDYVTDSAELFAFFQKLLPEFVRRNKMKQSFIEQGLEENEIFQKMKAERPIFIVIADLSEFMQMVYRPQADVGEMAGFVENIMEKGSLHNIYFIASLKTEDESMLTIYRAYTLYTGYKKGVHLGGNLSMQKVFDFQNLSFAQQSKNMKKGFGYVSNDEEEGFGIEIRIPIAKK